MTITILRIGVCTVVNSFGVRIRCQPDKWDFGLPGNRRNQTLIAEMNDEQNISLSANHPEGDFSCYEDNTPC